MSADIEEWPPLNDANAFESLCLDLWKEIWNDSGAQKNGRSGQPQAGIDVFGRHEGQQIGIQCKQKDELLHIKVTKAELEQEVKAAQNFRPPLTTFILATSGPRDALLQEHARLLSAENERKGLFDIQVWSWKEIWREIYQRQELLKRIGPIYWPRQAAREKAQRDRNNHTILAICSIFVVLCFILGVIIHKKYRPNHSEYGNQIDATPKPHLTLALNLSPLNYLDLTNDFLLPTMNMTNGVAEIRLQDMRGSLITPLIATSSNATLSFVLKNDSSADADAVRVSLLISKRLNCSPGNGWYPVPLDDVAPNDRLNSFGFNWNSVMLPQERLFLPELTIPAPQRGILDPLVFIIRCKHMPNLGVGFFVTFINSKGTSRPQAYQFMVQKIAGTNAALFDIQLER